MARFAIKLTPLKHAISSLREAVEQPMLNDKELGEYIRDSIIQRFEYTYELSWKLLRRYLVQEYDLSITSIRQMYREAAKLGLIDNVEAWFAYQEARNLTSHTYNEDTADETCEVAKRFVSDAEKMFNKLDKAIKNADK